MGRFRKVGLFILCFACLSMYDLVSRSGGPGGLQLLQVSGAPNEGTCANCHFGGAGGGSIAISSSNLNGGYLPGQSYNLQVTLTDVDGAIGGFQMVALDGNLMNVGTFSVNNGLQTVTIGSKTYVEHSNPNFFDFSSGQSQWNFNWIAPSQSKGNVTFYVSGVAADWLGTFDGDDVYVNSLSFAALPVEFGAFEVEPLPMGRAHLRWSTLQEINSHSFVIERSNDGEFFSPVGQLPAAGYAQEERWYEYTDEVKANGSTYYYRIKELDPNGASTLSDPREVFIPFTPSTFLSAYPNPAILQDNIFVDFFAAQTEVMKLRIRSINGQVVARKEEEVKEGRNKITLPIQDLKRGHYFVECQWGDQVNIQKLVIAN